MKHLELSTLIMFVVLVTVHCENVSYVRQLYTDLFSNYTKEVMPVYDHSKPLMVGVIFFYLSAINSFKEVEDTVSITGAFNFNWIDPFLAWNPSSYGNVYMTIIDSSDMWVPFIVLANSANTMEQVGGGTKFKAFLWYAGDVIYGPAGNFETKCPTDIPNFPLTNNIVSLPLWLGECRNNL